MNTSEQAQFLHNELFSMTLMATVQRGRVYRRGATQAEKASFQMELRRQLEAAATNYKVEKTDAAHEDNILALSTSLSTSHRSTLLDGRFRIGSAQKALNLFLKYLWCIGEVSMPPHCPFDFQIIKRLPRAARCNWTALDSIEQYRGLVAAARTALLCRMKRLSCRSCCFTTKGTNVSVIP